jgi:predicted lipoprotein with Yx(FWY)xxD motif
MNRIKSILPGLAIAYLLAACAALHAADAPAKKSGDVLVNQAGMTLYTYDKDAAGSGKSACNGPCTTNWPPLAADANAKDSGAYTVVTRDDGSKQWAYKGKPLYLYKTDQKPGDRSGDNFRDVWHVVKD